MIKDSKEQNPKTIVLLDKTIHVTDLSLYKNILNIYLFWKQETKITS